jgi:tetratricopeptide (TPR) repeat protein
MRGTFLILVGAMLYLSLSGFECASTEMTTAKVALQRKDFKAAEDALRKEVTTRPQNAEAWKMLGGVYYAQERYIEMDRAYTSAMSGTTPALKDVDKQEIMTYRYNSWAKSYQRAIDAYNEGIKANNTQLYQEALVHLDTATLMRPTFAQNIFIRSAILSGLDRDADVRKAYTDYIAAVAADVDRGLKAGLALGQSPEQVEAKLGKATRAKLTDSTGGYYFYESQNLYVDFAPSESGNRPEVQGWHYYSEPVPPFIAEVPEEIRSTPYYILGFEAYKEGATNKARYNDALKYFQTLQRLDPRREGIGQLIAEIYVTSGRTAEAKALLEQQIRDNPKEPALYISYGNLLFEAKQYQASAESFRKVLDLGLKNDDPNLGVALFNLGAVYKNMGADMQDSIRRVSNAPSPAQIEVYRKPLRESAKYFEQIRSMPGRATDYKLLAELGNLYDVLGEQAKVQQILTDLEKLEKDNKNDSQYWSAMSRFYAIIGDAKKAEMADKKATETSK